MVTLINCKMIMKTINSEYLFNLVRQLSIDGIIAVGERYFLSNFKVIADKPDLRLSVVFKFNKKEGEIDNREDALFNLAEYLMNSTLRHQFYHLRVVMFFDRNSFGNILFRNGSLRRQSLLDEEVHRREMQHRSTYNEYGERIIPRDSTIFSLGNDEYSNDFGLSLLLPRGSRPTDRFWEHDPIDEPDAEMCETCGESH